MRRYALYRVPVLVKHLLMLNMLVVQIAFFPSCPQQEWEYDLRDSSWYGKDTTTCVHTDTHVCEYMCSYLYLSASLNYTLNFYMKTFSNWISTAFIKCSSSAEQGLVSAACQRTGLLYFWRRPKRPGTSWQHPYCSIPVPYDFHSQHSASPHWQGDGQLLRLSASVEEKGNKRCFTRLWPKHGSTYWQKNFLTVPDEFKEDQLSHLWSWRRP